MISKVSKALPLLAIALPLSLAACNSGPFSGAPTQDEVTKIYNDNIKSQDGRKVKLTDLRCTKHENASFVCFVGYKVVDKAGNDIKNMGAQGRTGVQFFRLDNKWVARGL
ncbi:hypothetical protein FAI40_04915 [Acetobacteraceae bacterium]|nr:hypothetical protein FAI40_04915 [Acetobacteraceae bacterium]